MTKSDVQSILLTGWSGQKAALISCILAMAFGAPAAFAHDSATPSGISFILTSDVHFGITRNNFRGAANVDAVTTNTALVQTINRLPQATLADDDGVGAGKSIGAIEFLAITGDLASRQELYPIHIQPAAKSWSEFAAVYIDGLTIRDSAGNPTRLCLMPGNHDVSNAIGFTNRMVPARDSTAMAEIYNRMMHPAKPLATEEYNYATDKINYSYNVGGIHAVFLTMWPDAYERAWMEQDLMQVQGNVPVFIFCHDQPDVDTRHLTNPNGTHDINGRDRFENVVSDVCADGPTESSPSLVEQRALAAFFLRHRNIVAYFHGHNNWTEYYDWHGPDNSVDLPVFRTDSPMKGKVSSKDETKLAFELITVDAQATSMTVRECLWNAHREENPSRHPVEWGLHKNLTLRSRAR